MIELPDDAPLAPAGDSPLGVGRPTLALSPDGSRLVYVARIDEGTKLFLRHMDNREVEPIAGTEGAHSPFFSPDGQWIGFFADEKLKKVSLSGGEPEILCPATLAFGACWSRNDVIYFVPTDFTNLWSVSSAGGTAQDLMPDKALKQTTNWPEVLPDGDSILFSFRTEGIGIFSIKTKKYKRLLDTGAYARYSPTGHLVFGDKGKIRAIRFDLSKLEVNGLPETIVEGVRTELQGAAQFALSGDGSIFYVAGIDARLGSLTWVDRNGNEEPLRLPFTDYGSFKISPDGTKVALTIFEGQARDIWIYDIKRENLTRLTSNQDSALPIWTPDGKWIFYRHNMHIYRIPADGSGVEEQITFDEPCPYGSPFSFSPKGDLFTTICQAENSTIWIVPVDPDQKSYPYLQSLFYEAFPAFSPDGRWIAYTSDEAGRWEIYIQSFPDPGGKRRVSYSGGEEVRWIRSGPKMFFRFGSGFWEAGVSDATEMIVDKPRLLFEGPYINLPGYSYDVSPEGLRFLVVKGPEQELEVGQLQVITNFYEKLKRLN